MNTIVIAFIASVLALVLAGDLYRRVLSAPAVNRRASGIASAIRTGAQAFLRRQYGLDRPLVEQYAVWMGFWPRWVNPD